MLSFSFFSVYCGCWRLKVVSDYSICGICCFLCINVGWLKDIFLVLQATAHLLLFSFPVCCWFKVFFQFLSLPSNLSLCFSVTGEKGMLRSFSRAVNADFNLTCSQLLSVLSQVVKWVVFTHRLNCVTPIIHLKDSSSLGSFIQMFFWRGKSLVPFLVGLPLGNLLFALVYMSSFYVFASFLMCALSDTEAQTLLVEKTHMFSWETNVAKPSVIVLDCYFYCLFTIWLILIAGFSSYYACMHAVCETRDFIGTEISSPLGNLHECQSASASSQKIE